MIGKGFYLCGCNPSDPKLKNYTCTVVGRTPNGEPIFSNKRYDSFRREVCPIHGQPLYGHASPMKQGPQGNDVIDHRAEYEARYGSIKAGEIVCAVDDRRDNRDPAAVGKEYLASRKRRKSTSNGG